ncbi:MAG TPA: hypothetical protein VGB83_05345 [Actinomycetota bacterium]
MSRTRAAALAILAAGLLALAPSAARAREATPAWRREVLRLLEARASAVLDRDREAFAETMAGARPGFRRARLAWFDGMGELPIDRYALAYTEDTYQDLAPLLERAPAGNEVHVVAVEEFIGFEGFDAEPFNDALYLTVVRRGGVWHVHDDAGLEDAGLLSARSPWDFAPVAAHRRGPVLVLHHGEPSTAARIARDTEAAIAHDARTWPFGWDRSIVVVIPSSVGELQRTFKTTQDLSPFVAFAASSVLLRDGSIELTASRVFLQPATFFGYQDSFRRDTLGHEMLHVASRNRMGPSTPAWLIEGVAQIYGEQGAQATATLAAFVRAGQAPGRLPRDEEFGRPPNERIHFSYQAAADFAAFVDERFGDGSSARLLRALGRYRLTSPGTPGYHLDRASRRVLDRPFESVERAWVRVVEKRFG